MSSIKITSAILCDDVRKEDNGKFILIGAYTGGINFNNALPQRMNSLYAFVMAKTNSAGIDFEYRMRCIDAKMDVFIGSARLALKEEVARQHKGEWLPIELSIPLAPSDFSQCGDYVVEFKEPGGRWRKIIEFDVSTRAKQPQHP